MVAWRQALLFQYQSDRNCFNGFQKQIILASNTVCMDRYKILFFMDFFCLVFFTICNLLAAQNVDIS